MRFAALATRWKHWIRASHDSVDAQRLSQSPDLLFFEPPSFDDRIVNQLALFSLLTNPRASMHDWIARHEDLCLKIIIPDAVRPEIRDKLDQANVTERVLFPGLDGLCLWLARYYRQLPEPRRVVPPDVVRRSG